MSGLRNRKPGRQCILLKLLGNLGRRRRLSTCHTVRFYRRYTEYRRFAVFEQFALFGG